MTADEIFEKIGYIKEKNTKILENLGFTKENILNKNKIVYTKLTTDYFGDSHFEFIVILRHRNGIRIDLISKYELTQEELKAINKKCEELGWI